MKIRVLIIILIISVNVAVFSQRHPDPRPPRRHGRGMFFDEAMLDRLGLAVETRAKMQNLFFEMRKKIIELQEEIRKKDDSLRQELEKNRPNVVKMKKLVTEIAEIRKRQKLESGMKRLELMLLLSPSQRRQFFDLMRERRRLFWKRMHRMHRKCGPGHRRESKRMGPPPKDF